MLASNATFNSRFTKCLIAFDSVVRGSFIPISKYMTFQGKSMIHLTISSIPLTELPSAICDDVRTAVPHLLDLRTVSVREPIKEAHSHTSSFSSWPHPTHRRKGWGQGKMLWSGGVGRKEEV